MSDHRRDDVWGRIAANAGATFHTVSGDAFTYQIEGNALRTNRTNYRLSRGNFEKAMALLPVDGPGGFGDAIRGSSYVFAILTDRRIAS